MIHQLERTSPLPSICLPDNILPRSLPVSVFLRVRFLFVLSLAFSKRTVRTQSVGLHSSVIIHWMINKPIVRKVINGEMKGALKLFTVAVFEPPWGKTDFSRFMQL